MSSMQELHAIVSGKVQGVGYRDFVQREAKKLGLTGWVKNLDDGTVEVVAQGERVELDLLVERLRRGPLLSSVREIAVKRTEPRESHDAFIIA